MIQGISSKLLPAGGVGIAARSGTGKSSWFFASEYVHCVLLADTGSQGHKIYHKGKRNAAGDPEDVVMFDPRKNLSPFDFAREQVWKWSDAGLLWVLDSFSTLIQHQCVWLKGTRKQLNQDEYMIVVQKARDLALTSSARRRRRRGTSRAGSSFTTSTTPRAWRSRCTRTSAAA